jgi:hypothetical protein
MLTSFISIIIFKGFVEPLAIAIFDLVVLPTTSSIFSNHLNPNMGEWLQNKNSKELSEAVVSAISKEVKGFANRPEFVKKLALIRLRKRYDFLTNVEKLESNL